MADRYQTFTQSGAGRFLVKRLGLPNPPVLRRYKPGQAVVEGPVLVGAAGDGHLLKGVRSVLDDVGAATHDRQVDDVRYSALVFDASGIGSSVELRELYDFFHPVIRSLLPSGRVIVLGASPQASTPQTAVAQRAVEGFVRSVGKELRHGSTAQLVYVAEGGEDQLSSTLRFLLSAKSAYVSGQVVRVTAGNAPDDVDWTAPLAGQVAVVTGAARGIGAAIAEVLARDGAHVVCLDRPAEGEALAKVATKVRGSTFALDVTDADAGQRLADHLRERHGKVDIVVHNAGVTRDKTLARMSDDKWDLTLTVNLESPQELTKQLMDDGVLGSGGRVVVMSSINGIAGSAGQTNYATSKAGLIGFVQANAPAFAETDMTINAVAPGFIDTPMTAAMPYMVREVSRRMNSMSQAGLPVDVAETVAWLAQPASGGVTGNVVRVCGQHLVGV